jgi:hypothetical protein
MPQGCMGSNPIPRTTMLIFAGGFVMMTLRVVFSFSEDLVVPEVADVFKLAYTS